MKTTSRILVALALVWVAGGNLITGSVAAVQPALSFEQGSFNTRQEHGGDVTDELTATRVSDAIDGDHVARWHFTIENGWLRRCVSFPAPIPADAKYISLWLRLVPKAADDFLRPTLSLELWERREGTRGRILTYSLGRLSTPGQWVNFTVPLEQFRRAWFSPSKAEGSPEPDRFVELALNTSSIGTYTFDIDAVEFTSNDRVRRALVIAQGAAARRAAQSQLSDCEVVQRTTTDWLRGDLPTFQIVVADCGTWKVQPAAILAPLRVPDEQEEWIHAGALRVRSWLRNGGLILVNGAETEAGRAFLEGLEGYFRDQFSVSTQRVTDSLVWANTDVPLAPWKVAAGSAQRTLLRPVLNEEWWPLISAKAAPGLHAVMASQTERGWVFAATSAVPLPIASIVAARKALRQRVARHDGVDIDPERRLWLYGRFDNRAELTIDPGASKSLAVHLSRTDPRGYLLRVRTFAAKPGGAVEALLGDNTVCEHVFTLDAEGAMQLAYVPPNEIPGGSANLILRNEGSAPLDLDAVQVEEYAEGSTFYIGATAWGDGWGRFQHSVTDRFNVSRVDGHFAWEKPAAFAKKIDPICARGAEPVVLLNAPRAGDSINGVGCGPPKPKFWHDTLTEMVRLYGKQVHFWEVWNEAGEYGWSYRGTADQFAALQAEAYDAIKPLEPDATVICGWMNDVARMLKDGGVADKCDAIAIHTYDLAGNWGFHYQQRIGEMLEYGIWRPLLATEQGFSVKHHPADQLRPLMFRGVGSLLDAGCNMMIAFYLGKPDAKTDGEWSIFEHDGKGGMRPRATWAGLAFWSQLARGTRVWAQVVPDKLNPDLFAAAARMPGSQHLVRVLLYSGNSGAAECRVTVPVAPAPSVTMVVTHEDGTTERRVVPTTPLDPTMACADFTVSVRGAVRIDLAPA